MHDIKKFVKSLIKRHKTNNPFEICQRLNILILYKDLGSVRGFFRHRYRKKIIYINSTLCPQIQRQVCAHELGHAVLHTKVNTVFLNLNTYTNTDKIEIEANTFASELLISDIDLMAYVNLTNSQIAAIFNVEEKLVQYKLNLFQK